jgi:phosphoadenosine phosphosulfate reductase
MTHIAVDTRPDLPLASVEDAGVALLRHAIRREFAGRFAVVSSFGADSAMLLALVAEIDPSVPVLFLDTGMHFPETLAYRDELAARLGLTDIRSITPDAAEVARRDPDGELHRYVPDDCCALRKVAPLERALAPFAAWATGRRRGQAATRRALPFVETVDGRSKYNPLADWSAERIAAELARRGLPRHELVARGFPSIGCAPCTRAVRPGEDARAGRWAGTGKVECGIHAAVPAARGVVAPGP